MNRITGVGAPIAVRGAGDKGIAFAASPGCGLVRARATHEAKTALVCLTKVGMFGVYSMAKRADVTVLGGCVGTSGLRGTGAVDDSTKFSG